MTNFKPGDWIKSTKYIHLSPIQINSIYESNTRPGILGLKSKGTVLYSDECVTWQPKPGEWCWFWKGYPSDEVPMLQQFAKHNEISQYETIQKGCFNHCEPLIGQLPTTIKDK